FFSRWRRFREIFSLPRDASQSEKNDHSDLDSRDRAQTMLSAIGAAVSTVDVKDTCKKLLRILDAMGVDLAINDELQKGRFSVSILDDGRSLTPTPLVELANPPGSSALLILL